MRDAQSFGQQIARQDAPRKVLRATVFEAGKGTAGVELADGVRLRRVATSGTLAVGDVVDVEISGGSARVLSSGEASGAATASTSGGVAGPSSGAPSPHDLLGAHHTLPTLSPNLFLASLLSGTGAPSFRAIGAADLPGQFAGFANPSAQIGLTAVNGAATTAMRSDAAPALNQGITPTWTGAHIFSNTVNINDLLTLTKTTEQLRMRYDASNYASFTVGSGGNLTVAPTGDFLFDPVGNDILPVTNYDLNLGSLSKKYLTLHAAELWVETLVAQDTIATIGGRVLVTPTTQLTRDLSSSAGSESTITQRGSATSVNGSSTSNSIAFVGSSQVYAAATPNITMNVPAGTSENHVMIAAVNYWGVYTLTAPGGWTLIATQEIAAGSGKVAIYYKVASASEPSNYTWTLSTGNYSVGFIATYSGVDTSAPIDVSAIEANSSSTSATQSAVTTTAANAMLLYFIGVDGASSLSISATPPSGMTERIDYAQSWGGFLYLAEAVQASAGTTGTKTGTLSTGKVNITALVALKPTSSSTQGAVTKPTGVTTGDLLLFTAAVGSASAALTTPSGLTQINTLSSSSGKVVWYYKVATASEPASYTFALNTTDSLSVSCVAYYNVDTTSPIEASSVFGNRADTSMTATGISPTSTTARLVFSGAAIDTSAGSITATAPSGMTELIDAGSGTVRIYLAHQALSAAGLTGDKTATLSSSKAYIVGLFALKPVTTGGGQTIYVKHNQMQAGDIVYMQANGRIEWMAITSAPTTVTAGAEYSYSVTRNLDGTGANAWNAGDAIANTGTKDSGFIDLYSLESIKGIPFDYIYNATSGGVFSSNYANESTWSLWDGVPASIGADDAIYYGCESAVFSAIHHYIWLPQVASSPAGTVEYWNGSAWTAVVGLTASSTLETAGLYSITWPAAAQSGWAKTTVNGASAYWIRHRITGGTWTQSPRQGHRRVYRDKNTWGPTIAGMVRASSTYNDIRERWAIGNLNGLYDYGSNVYGSAFGDPLLSWLGIDATNGVRIMNGATPVAKWDTAGNITIGDASSGKAYTYITSGEVEFRSSDNSYFKIDSGGRAVFKQGTSAANGTTWIDANNVDIVNIRAGIDLSNGSVNTAIIEAYDTGAQGRIYLKAGSTGATFTTFDVDGDNEWIRAGKAFYADAALNVAGAADFNGTANFDGAATFNSTLTANSTSTHTAGIKVPRSSGSSLFALDASGTGSTFTLANNATTNLFGSTAFVGLIMITNNSTGGEAVFFVRFGSTHLIADPSSTFSTASGTANKNNVYKSGSGQPIVVENKTGSSSTYAVTAFRHA